MARDEGFLSNDGKLSLDMIFWELDSRVTLGHIMKLCARKKICWIL
jgi:hypothetical protein